MLLYTGQGHTQADRQPTPRLSFHQDREVVADDPVSGVVVPGVVVPGVVAGVVVGAEVVVPWLLSVAASVPVRSRPQEPSNRRAASAAAPSAYRAVWLVFVIGSID